MPTALHAQTSWSAINDFGRNFVATVPETSDAGSLFNLFQLLQLLDAHGAGEAGYSLQVEVAGDPYH